MPWTKNDFPASMKNLEEPVREKAIEIANKLIKDNYEEDRAIPIAISTAKEWYENRGETTTKEVTHSLVPEKDKWVLEGTENKDRIVFDTKEEAMDKIKEMSKSQAIRVMIHDSQGKLQKLY